ncbi:probable ATP-dependent RNA helicase DHX35 [Neocloeon triangulifer]|uniref:probable ATP-dependent RNA helicase DHX35 n=1 Tax=Neocloeon triangulifer TaxID=2078957 RepID=UPI00286F3E12|nr:probable ATP-dependent RNA helicase DHX35 [Neocloeon triangulifer]
MDRNLTGSFRPSFKRPADTPWSEDKSDLDPTDGTSFIFNPHHSLSYEQQRQKLPIFQNRNHILYLLEKHQTLILVGETGCGKSTQVPQYLFEAGWCDDGKLVGITEPRRVAATTLAQRVAEEKGCILGGLVGYSIRFDDCFDPTYTRIKYMTEGILIREMMADPLLRQYSVIILDEVHERTLNTDIVMGLMKKILRKNTKLRLIVSSATVDAEQLRMFFSSGKNDNSAAILSVEGRLYEVTVNYVIDPVPDYVDGVVSTCLKIHQNLPSGDILAFLTGQEEVDRAVSRLEEHAVLDKGKLKMQILPMYGSLPNSDQLKVFRYAQEGHRKIVIATNIAETSVTIPGIVYVVDSGYMKLRWFNTSSLTDALIVVPVSQASADQRAGRAGRVRPGMCFRLYTEQAYNELQRATPPEMERSELSSALLQLKALGIDNVLRFTFPSPPPAASLLAALELLYALGGLDREGQLTHPLGATMAELPCSALQAKCLVSSGEYGCSEEILSIMAMLQVQNVFLKPASGQGNMRCKVARRQFEVEEGDLLTLLNVYNAYMASNKTKDWCSRSGLNSRALKRACEIRSRMEKLLNKKFNIPIASCHGSSEVVTRCLAAGFFPNAAYLHHSGAYRTVRGDIELAIHPSSVLYAEEYAEWLIYSEILHTGKAYMKDITVIEPGVLEDVAPHFYEKVVERNRE